MRYLTLEEVLYIHHEAITRFGGHPGIADIGLLQSAIARPQLTFGNKAVYKNIYEQAAALVESLVQNHGFVDGNKRVGAYALGLFLQLNGYELKTRNLELSDFILEIAQGKKSWKQIVNWIVRHARNVKRG